VILARSISRTRVAREAPAQVGSPFDCAAGKRKERIPVRSGMR